MYFTVVDPAVKSRPGLRVEAVVYDDPTSFFNGALDEVRIWIFRGRRRLREVLEERGSAP